MNPIPDPSETTVKIPFKVVNGRITYLYGNRLPKFKEGAIGDLILPRFDVLNGETFPALKAEDAVVLLSPGDELLLAMRCRQIPEDKYDELYKCDPDGPKSHFSRPAPKQTTRLPLHPLEPVQPRPLVCHTDMFVSVTLVEPLFLLLRGTKSAVLKKGRCHIPALKRDAVSINHAYTLISQVFEPDRKSHTGNVFERVRYFEGEYWRPLDELRKDHEAEFEKRLIAEAKKRKRRGKPVQTALDLK